MRPLAFHPRAGILLIVLEKPGRTTPSGEDLDFHEFARSLTDKSERDNLDEVVRSPRLALSHTLFLRATREAERPWMRKMPLDYREFRTFCGYPQHPRYEDRRELVIEIFPKADFYHPPPELSNAGLVSNPLTTLERGLLSMRAQWSVNGLSLHSFPPGSQHLDRKVYEGLMELWLREIPNLPRLVRHVVYIFKSSLSTRDNPTFATRRLKSSAPREIKQAIEATMRIATGMA